ncbi:LOW QUALITY PROTEIN: hypothetical protein KUTeg_003873 [Tegillarca granosa]|uniref:Uncharacterized protein n=1 Tax=Tegillarca granosa TaxID=220873 RepID=A0ABQ9FQ64_TEGGR|nr:LOW QUALITY PROTEIN: hypothetical protein KUTeg_003873 [Tegillarca granosa]
MKKIRVIIYQVLWTESMRYGRKPTDIDKEKNQEGIAMQQYSRYHHDQNISTLLDRVALKCTRLFGNFTSNLVESWMAIRSKFDVGKLYNRCNRGSWHDRCYGGALRKKHGSSVGHGKYGKRQHLQLQVNFLKGHMKDQALALSKQSQTRTGNRKRRWDRKMNGIQESTTKTARKEYDSEALEAEKIKAIEETTRKPSATAVWKEERRKILTASNFGLVIRRNPNIKVEKLVKQLYQSFKENKFTRKGLNDEIITIKEYTSRKEEENDPVTVQSIGLVISKSRWKVINKLGKVGLLEIKNLLHNKIETLNEAARRKYFCLQLINKKLHLKHQHQFYYQVQDQLNIIDMA